MSKLKGLKILVVDDDPDLRELVSDAFAMEGADVRNAESGQVASTLMKLYQFDIVMSDMRMANGDGRFVANCVLQLKEPKPVVYIYSGYNDLKQEELQKLGILEVFSKPFSLSKVADAFLAAMGSPHLAKK